jgi:phage-related protein
VADAIVTDVLARISADASNFVRNMNQAAQTADNFGGSLRNAGNAINGTNQQIQGLAGGASLAHKTMMGLGTVTAIAGGAMIAFGVKSFYAAAQVNEMDVAMRAVGNSTGLGYTAMRQATIAVRDNGIEMASAQQMVLLYAKAQLNLADASKVARVAQDLAVLSGANSTETAMRLTYAIMNQDTLMLRHLGITKTASQAFEEYARANNTSAKALTEFEKKQAITNMVVAEGGKVFGVYEAAMKEPAKVLRSFPRLFNEMQVSVGQGLTKAFGPLILSTYNAVKAFTALVNEGGALTPIVDAIGRAFVYATAPITAVMEAIGKFLTKMQVLSKGAERVKEHVYGVAGSAEMLEAKTKALSETFAKFLPLIAAVGTALSLKVGKELTAGIPILGRFVSAFHPLVGALLAFVLTSPAIQNALGNLISAFSPLIDLFKGSADTIGGAFTGAINIVAGAINVLASGVRTVTEFIARNAETVKILVGVLLGAYAAYRLITGAMVVYNTILRIVQTAQLQYHLLMMGTTTSVGKLTKAMGLLKAAFLANPVGAIIAGIAILVAAFVLAWKRSETFRDVMTEVFNTVAKYAGIYIAYLLRTLAKIIGAFGSLMEQGNVFRSIFVGYINTVAKAYGWAISTILGAFANFIGGISRLLESNEGLRKGLITIINGFANAYRFVFGDMLGVLADFILKLADFLGSNERFRKGFVVIFNGVAKALGYVVGFLLDSLAFFLTGLANVIGKVSGFGKGMVSLFNAIGTGVTKALGNLWDKVKGFFNKLTTPVKAILNALGFDKIAKGIETVAGSLGSFTKGVFNFADKSEAALRSMAKTLGTAADNARKFTAKDFGSAIYDSTVAALTKTGTALKKFSDNVKKSNPYKDVGTGMVSSIISGFAKAETVIQGWANKIKTFSEKDFGGAIADYIVRAAQTASDWLNSAADKVLEFTGEDFVGNVAEAVGNFTDLIGGMFDDLTNAGETIETIFDNVGDGLDDVADGVDDAAQRAADRLKRITDAAKSALAEIQKQAQEVLSFSDTVKKAITDFGGISSLAPEQGVPVTANMIIDNMRQRLAKITKFGNDLRALAGMGLNNASLQELIQAGPIAGGTMAAALLKEGQSAVTQVNTFQSGIDLAGSAVGDIAARSQFGMGTVEAQGVVNTRIEVKEGAVQIVFGEGIDSETKTDIRETVNDAIKEAMAELAREIANSRTA